MKDCRPSSFFDLLIQNEVQTIVDVRENPISRKPGFSRSALAAASVMYGLNYVHIPALGSPKNIRHAYRADRDWERFSERFLVHLATQGDALYGLAELARRERCCLLCFEADPSLCHRSVVAEQVVTTAGLTLPVVHLTAQNPVRIALDAPPLV
jgi:uncharacterized protein (DUF488 family)